MRLTVDTVRHLINPPGQWTAMATGPVFGELAIHTWQVNCDSCAKELNFEFAVDAKLGKSAEKPAATARIAELGWKPLATSTCARNARSLRDETPRSAAAGRCRSGGCAAEPVQLQQNRSYILEWIGERPLMDYSHLTVTLGDDGRAYGNGGCNHWFAPYTLEGDKLSFGPIGKTRKLCAPALMEQEQRFLQALQGVERWDISPIEQMRFWPAKASRCAGG
jgi:heat shock protein HslJ